MSHITYVHQPVTTTHDTMVTYLKMLFLIQSMGIIRSPDKSRTLYPLEHGSYDQKYCQRGDTQ